MFIDINCIIDMIMYKFVMKIEDARYERNISPTCGKQLSCVARVHFLFDLRSHLRSASRAV